MLQSQDEDYLLRQISDLVDGLVRELGLGEEPTEEPDDEDDDGEQPTFQDLERQEEADLGIPVSLALTMPLDGVVQLLSPGGRPDGVKLVMLGLILARRAARTDDATLRIRALGVLTRGVEARPDLMDDELSALIRGLLR